MNFEDVNIIWIIGGLVLAVSALTARRLSLGAVLRSLIGWVVVIGVAWAMIAHRDQVERVVNAVAERVGAGEQTVEGEAVRIQMSADGHFWARVKINGYSKRMLVDSGATLTAINPETARDAGVEVGTGGFPVVITTANGSIAAQRARVERVAVGSLETRNLSVVVSPAFGNVDVLGMNFLSRLGSWRVEGKTLILEPKANGDRPSRATETPTQSNRKLT
jgi:aspartyl protease family protein